MECLAGVAAAGGLGSKEVFHYNRDNFLYDRRLRLKKELKVQEFRIEQAELWREDVRDLISLSEYKMHVYLLVNVLMLGFTIVLYSQGRLPEEGCPDWLTLGYVLAITGSFTFLLLSIWLAMQAAVAAQSYETRLLTQLVRLPIPSWQEVEACRTYASEFEQVEPRQMFRVPFVTGRQERLVGGPSAGRVRLPEPSDQGSEQDEIESAASSEAPISSAGSRPSASAELGRQSSSTPAHCDPWGLERRGDSISELGCKNGHDVAKLRHIQLARHAMTYWQTYDAFARVSLSIGVNQLLLAMSYYIIAYVMMEVGWRSVATYGILLLTAMAETLTRLDMSLSMGQLRSLQLFLAVGPLASCFAGCQFMSGTAESHQTAETSIVLSFFCHSMYLALMSHFCRIRQQDNGAMLPMAFRSVLYLDVFGWLKVAQQEEDSASVTGLLASPSADHSDATARSAASPYVEDYMPSDSAPSPSARTATLQPQTASRPALAAMKYADGRPIPQRPEDMAPSGAVEDMRGLPEAPQPRALIGEGEDTEFYSAASWLQGREVTEGMVVEEPGSIVTGHEKEPGILPWIVFTTAMRALCAAWVVGAVYHSLGASKVWDLDIPGPAWLEIPRPVPTTTDHSLRPRASMLGRGAGSTLRRLRQERVSVSWPYRDLAPRSLSCDANGQRFVVSDGLTLYTAVLNSSNEPSTFARLRPAQHVNRLVAIFMEAPCMPLVGEGLQDVAVTCDPSSGVQAPACEALVLYQQGRRVARCSLEGAEGAQGLADTPGGRGMSISGEWLERLRDGTGEGRSGEEERRPHGRLEKVVAISVDADCAASAGQPSNMLQNCTLLGTTQGRVVRLRRHPTEAARTPAAEAQADERLTPAEELLEGSGAREAMMRPGTMRGFNGGNFGILQEGGQTIQVFGGGADALAGRLSLPPAAPAAAFCVGGGHIYVLGDGPDPQLWRSPLPEQLGGPVLYAAL